MADHHHRREPLAAEPAGDLLLHQDAAVVVRAQVLDVVAELDVPGVVRRDRGDEQGADDDGPGMAGAPGHRLLDAERVEVEAVPDLLAPGPSLVPGDHRRQQEEDGDQAEHDPGPDQKPEVPQPLVVGDAHGVEGSRRGDRPGEDAERGGAHHQAERVGERAASLALLDITGVHHDGEVGAETHQHRREPGGRRVEMTQGDVGDRQGGELPDQERHRGIEDRPEAAVAEVIKKDDDEERQRAVAHHVLHDQAAVFQGDDIAAAVRHFGRAGHGARRPGRPRPGRLAGRGALRLLVARESALERRRRPRRRGGDLRHQQLVEGDVLGRLDRLGDHQERVAVLRQVVPLVPLHRERALVPQQHLEQQGTDEERVLLEDLLGKERRGAGQLADILAHPLADRLIGELGRQIVNPRRWQEQRLVPAEEREEGARGVDLVLDVPDRGDRLELLGQKVRVLLKVFAGLSLARLDQDDQIVETAEIADRPLEGVDNAVVLRNQVQHVPVETQPAAQVDGGEDHQEGDQEDRPVPPAGEFLDAQEEPLLAPARHQISRRPSSAFPTVTSSAYSSSEPTARPIPIRVTLRPSGLRSRDR